MIKEETAYLQFDNMKVEYKCTYKSDTFIEQNIDSKYHEINQFTHHS